MWLPTPIYKRVPQFWLLLGLLFMSSGTYLGFDYSLSFVYFGVGFVCAARSLWVFSMRAAARRKEPVPATVPPPAATDAPTEEPQHDDLNQGVDTTA